MKLKKLNTPQGTLTTKELPDAENFLIRTEQERWFKEEYVALSEGRSLEKNSPLLNFAPYMDDNKLLRLGGRLELCNLSTEEKHPIILDKNSWLTNLMVRKYHDNGMHGGVAYTLARIRSRFWIPKGRQLVKNILKKMPRL